MMGVQRWDNGIEQKVFGEAQLKSRLLFKVIAGYWHPIGIGQSCGKSTNQSKLNRDSRSRIVFIGECDWSLGPKRL